ncbi:MAG: VanZ family protein, partial [Roseovarius sp.]|nr:VanZ family protein [Roseovarius sp.]
ALTMPMAYIGRLPLWQVVLAGAAYGGVIELVQPYVGRSAEWGDLLADGLGAFVGALAAAIVARRRAASCSGAR